ncbi:AAA family ATPase [Streptomyces sp. PU10]|uniref:AAA family ATPase n=1 Tax=Streptomyces sp. PU10 TaxID=3062780 RepID=UPI0028FC4D3C|nr:AAA family ATPase [Streptomyces sp. PU10]MDU0258376.1 AAA family ATPase [Streptomyces sp. PU10]
MLVTSVEIETFRNITNKQAMVVDPEVTCLIGKNESGKTTVLKALHRLNPANNADDFHVTTDYPRRNLARDRRTKDLDTVAPVTAVFKLEDADFDAIAELVGVRPPAQAYVTASRLYDGSLQADVHCALEDVLADVFEEASVDDEEDQKAITGDHTTIEAVSAAAKARAKEVNPGRKTARGKAIEKVPAELDRYKKYVEERLDDEEHEQLIELLPKFFYFSTYEMLPGDCDLHALAERARAKRWERGDETMMSLLRLAGEGPDDFLDEDYASRKAELQAASLDLSVQVFQYWKQNEDLTVVFDTDLIPMPRAPTTSRSPTTDCSRSSCATTGTAAWRPTSPPAPPASSGSSPSSPHSASTATPTNASSFCWTSRAPACTARLKATSSGTSTASSGPSSRSSTPPTPST